MRSFGKLAFASVSLLAISVPAMAQTTNAPAEEADDDETIEVVGTLIRNAEVVGGQTINVGQQEILEKGAGTTNELLGTLPQLAGTFNGRFEIDPRWGGELPRVYLYDRQHTRRAHSGRLDTRELERWIAEQVTPAATPAR